MSARLAPHFISHLRHPSIITINANNFCPFHYLKLGNKWNNLTDVSFKVIFCLSLNLFFVYKGLVPFCTRRKMSTTSSKWGFTKEKSKRGVSEGGSKLLISNPIADGSAPGLGNDVLLSVTRSLSAASKSDQRRLMEICRVSALHYGKEDWSFTVRAAGTIFCISTHSQII